MLGSSGAFGFDFLNTTGGQGVNDYLKVEQDLISRFIDYEDQDDSPLISSALDVYSDDASQLDQLSDKSIWPEAEDEDIREKLEDMFDTVKTEEKIWEQVRSLCKYGNDIQELVVKSGEGVVASNYLPAPTVRRIEVPGQDGSVIGYLYDPRGSFNVSTKDFFQRLENKETGRNNQYGDNTTSVLEDWETIHMRLRGKSRNSIYGYGIGEPARWIYKRLVLLEDSIVMHRLSRAPSRYAFYIDVSNVPPNEVNGYLNQVKARFKKKKFLNSKTGELDQSFDVFSSDEDFFMPTREGNATTRVESLAGPVYDQIDDIKFFENKLFAALKVPKPFLTYEESTAKTHLSAEDARFARTIMRIQREVKNGYRRMGRVHLAAIGIDPDRVDFSIQMTIPSAIFELAQLEIRSAELELADKFQAWAPRYWIMTNILGFSDDQIKEMEELRVREVPGEEGAAPGAAAGSIAKAVAKRGSPGGAPAPEAPRPTPAAAAPSPEGGAPEAASRYYGTNSDRFLMAGIKKNTDSLNEKINDMRKTDKSFDAKWSRMEGLLKDLQHTMRKK